MYSPFLNSGKGELVISRRISVCSGFTLHIPFLQNQLLFARVQETQLSHLKEDRSTSKNYWTFSKSHHLACWDQGDKMQPTFYATSQQIIECVTQTTYAVKNKNSTHFSLSSPEQSLSLGLDFTTNTTDLNEKPTFGMQSIIVVGIAFPNNRFRCLSSINCLYFLCF